MPCTQFILTTLPSNGVDVMQIDELTKDMVVSYVDLNGIDIDVKVNTGAQVNVPKHVVYKIQELHPNIKVRKKISSRPTGYGELLLTQKTSYIDSNT